MKHKLKYENWFQNERVKTRIFPLAQCCTIAVYHRVLNWVCGENISMHSSSCVRMTWGNPACRVFIFSICVLYSKNKSDEIQAATNVLGTRSKGYIYLPFSRYDKITFYLLVKQRDLVNREVAGVWLWRLYVSKRDKGANCLLDYFDSFSIRRNIAIDSKWNFRQWLAVVKNIFLGRFHLRRRNKNGWEKILIFSHPFSEFHSQTRQTE